MLSILQSDLKNPSAERSIDHMKADIVAHMLIPYYQGVLKAAHDMDAGTNVAAAHTEGVGGIEGVARAKGSAPCLNIY